MAYIRLNTADQELDIRGSGSPKDTLISSEEALGLGERLDSGSNASIFIGGQLSGIAGMLATSRGKFVTISGANDPNNNGIFKILTFINATTVVIENALASTDLNNGNLSWIYRKAYSLEDDLNYERTDRAEIKGVPYYDPVPTYVRCTDISTDVPASLQNIAGKTTDAKSIVTNKKFENATIVVGSSYYLLSDPGNLPYADVINRTGVPISDGADIGNEDATRVELGNLHVLFGPNAGWKVYGRARHGLTGVDGNSFEVEFRAEQGLVNVAYTWESGLPTIIDIFYPYRYCFDGMPESALRTCVSGDGLPVPTSVGQVLFCVDVGVFTPCQPITADDGWLVNIDGILIVTAAP